MRDMGEDSPGDLDWFPVVERLEFSELLSVAFHQVRELVEKARSLDAGDVLAPCSGEGLPGSGDGDVDVFG